MEGVITCALRLLLGKCFMSPIRSEMVEWIHLLLMKLPKRLESKNKLIFKYFVGLNDNICIKISENFNVVYD